MMRRAAGAQADDDLLFGMEPGALYRLSMSNGSMLYVECTGYRVIEGAGGHIDSSEQW